MNPKKPVVALLISDKVDFREEENYWGHRGTLHNDERINLRRICSNFVCLQIAELQNTSSNNRKELEEGIDKFKIIVGTSPSSNINN